MAASHGRQGLLLLKCLREDPLVAARMASVKEVAATPDELEPA